MVGSFTMSDAGEGMDVGVGGGVTRESLAIDLDGVVSAVTRGRPTRLETGGDFEVREDKDASVCDREDDTRRAEVDMS